MKFQNQHTASIELSTMPQKRPLSNLKPQGAHGFTLIEVLIAMAIFAIGILAVTTMQMRSINQNASARMQTEATTLAVDWMERLLSLPYEDAWLDEAASPYEIQSGNYIIECTINEDPENLGLPIKQIQIMVSNPNPNARNKPVILSSIKGQGQAEGIGP
ncbi:MAG: type IV pilus modification protein PilV [Desulfobacterales bacterium]